MNTSLAPLFSRAAAWFGGLLVAAFLTAEVLLYLVVIVGTAIALLLTVVLLTALPVIITDGQLIGWAAAIVVATLGLFLLAEIGSEIADKAAEQR